MLVTLQLGYISMCTLDGELFFKDLEAVAQGVDPITGEDLYVDRDGHRWSGILLWCKADMEDVAVEWGSSATG